MKPANERLKPLPWLDYERLPVPGRHGTGKRAKVLRGCGPCTACCTVVPVAEIGKGAHERCQYLEPGKGCGIYNIRPTSCFGWSCYWVLDDDLPEELRPDVSHLVIDMAYDVIETTDNETGETGQANVLVLWGDPAFPEAHRAPAVREFLQLVWDKTMMPTMVRMDDGAAFLIVPPAQPGDEWLEKEMIRG